MKPFTAAPRKMDLSSVRDDPQFKDRVLLMAITVFALYIRLAHLFEIDIFIPSNWGGLYAEFSYQIAENGFRLPETIPYYSPGGIPYAYPPLAFIIHAFLVHVLNFHEVVMSNLLPPLFSAAAYFSFILLAREALSEPSSRLVSLLFFAGIPNSYTEQIPAAGLAESLGTLTIIWLAFFMLRAIKAPTCANAVLTGLFISIAFLSSPGSAYASAVMALFFGVYQLWKKRLSYLGVAAAVAIAGVSPYLVTVISVHGITVFTSSLLAQHVSYFDHVVSMLYRLIIFNFYSIPNLAMNLLLFTGCLLAIQKIRYPLLALFVAFMIVPYKEGYWLLSVPISLLSGLGLEFLQRTASHYLPEDGKNMLLGALFIPLVLGFLIFFSENESNLTAPPESNLSSDAVDVMMWAGTETSEGASFIVLSNPNTIEWFPHIARRTVINTHFGVEWDVADADNYQRFMERTVDCDSVDCYCQVAAEIYREDDIYLVTDHVLADAITIYQNDEFWVYRYD